MKYEHRIVEIFEITKPNGNKNEPNPHREIINQTQHNQRQRKVNKMTARKHLAQKTRIAAPEIYFRDPDGNIQGVSGKYENSV